MAKRYTRSRWNATRSSRPSSRLTTGQGSVPAMREVRNSDGEVLRKVEVPAGISTPSGAFGSGTVLDTRVGGRMQCGRVVGGDIKSRVYYRDSRRRGAADCL